MGGRKRRKTTKTKRHKSSFPFPPYYAWQLSLNSNLLLFFLFIILFIIFRPFLYVHSSSSGRVVYGGYICAGAIMHRDIK